MGTINTAWALLSTHPYPTTLSDAWEVVSDATFASDLDLTNGKDCSGIPLPAIPKGDATATLSRTLC